VHRLCTVAVGALEPFGTAVVRTAVGVTVFLGPDALQHGDDSVASGKPCTVAQRALVGIDYSLPIVKAGAAAHTCIAAQDWIRGVGPGHPDHRLGIHYPVRRRVHGCRP
jgi:hypothetical protein